MNPLAGMTQPSELTSISKFLSLVLRHKPQSIGLTLDDAGWTGIEELLAKATAAGRCISRDALAEVVRSSDKQRFAVSADGLRIRANQGHSVAVSLGLDAATPPDTLFHGTASRFLAAILDTGLDKLQRHHVHLTHDPATARAVGQRYGAPVVLEIDAARLCADGHVFHRSANGVWLVDHVPPAYLKVHTTESRA
jgi:putative RNA 2'-phosphotransferase